MMVSERKKHIFLALFLGWSGMGVAQYAKKRITIINDTQPPAEIAYSYTMDEKDLGPNPLPLEVDRQLTHIIPGDAIYRQQSTYIFVTEDQPKVSIYEYMDYVDPTKSVVKNGVLVPFREKRWIKTAILAKAMYEDVLLAPGDTVFKYSEVRGKEPQGKEGISYW